jgi:hypothetical protein
VIKHKVSVWILEAVQVPVGVGRQHDGSRLGQGESAHSDVPLKGSNSVGDVRDDFTWKALGAVLVGEGEGDGVGGVGDDGPVAPIPALGTAVKGVVVVVFVGEDVGGFAVDGEGGILDAVSIAA